MTQSQESRDSDAASNVPIWLLTDDRDGETIDCAMIMGGGRIQAAREHWVKEEAAVDSGSVDPVLNRSKFPHLVIEDTQESMRGEAWTGAGVQRIPKEGQARLDWPTGPSSKSVLLAER